MRHADESAMKYLFFFLSVFLLQGAVVAHDMDMHKKSALATSAAFAPDGSLWMIGLNSNKQLVIRTSEDNGSHWGDERSLATGTDVVAADGENRPKIIFGPQNVVIVTYTQ